MVDKLTKIDDNVLEIEETIVNTKRLRREDIEAKIDQANSNIAKWSAMIAELDKV